VVGRLTQGAWAAEPQSGSAGVAGQSAGNGPKRSHTQTRPVIVVRTRSLARPSGGLRCWQQYPGSHPDSPTVHCDVMEAACARTRQ
jgi:hypothetical protein